jgi:hypothetical protein
VRSLTHRAARPNGPKGPNGTGTFRKTEDRTPALPSRWLAAFEAQAPWNMSVPKGSKGADSSREVEHSPNMLVPLEPKGAKRPDEQKCARRAGCPADWAEGATRLASSAPVLDWPPQRWSVLVEDARTFLERWAVQAHQLGWRSWELFGCHRRRPWGAVHGLGLVPLLGGDELVVMTDTEAIMHTPTGNRQTYRRKIQDPLPPSERALIWELGH